MPNEIDPARPELPNKTEGTFISDGLELKYTMYQPETKSDEPTPLLLMLHGASSQAGNGRVLFDELQRKMADIGYASFSYDTRGVGQSQGEYEDSTLTNRYQDAYNAVEFLMENGYAQDGNIVILGLSMAGHVVATMTDYNPLNYKAVILVNPAAYGADATDKKLKPSTEFTDTIRRPNSWTSSPAFVGIAEFEGPVMMADSEYDDVIEPGIKKNYILAIQNLQKHVILPEVKHAFFSSAQDSAKTARELLYEEIVKFLEELS